MLDVSEAYICNLALIQKIGRNKTIATLDEDSPEGTACRYAYDHNRKFCLRLSAPSCARKVIALSPTAVPPVKGFAYEYEYPNDCLRVIGIVNKLDPKGPRPPMERGVNSANQAVIWTNEPDAELEYIFDLTDPVKFDDGFIAQLSTFIGKQICLPLTQDKGIYDRLDKEVQFITLSAQYMDNLENRPAPQPDAPWLDARR